MNSLLPFHACVGVAYNAKISDIYQFSGAHTLWELPVLTMRFGGVVFILIYLVMFLLLGTPMLLLEMTMGQYSALSPTKLYRNLCPVSESF